MSATYERSDRTSSGQFVNAKMHDMNDIRTHLSDLRNKSQLLPKDSDIPSRSSSESIDSEEAAIKLRINDSMDDEDYVEGKSKLNKRTTATEIEDSYDYYQFTLPSGETVRTYGALLPSTYQNHTDPQLPWICPVRSCRTLFSSLRGLGGHFNAGHTRAKMNDNDDGTLSIVGWQSDDGNRKPAIVTSRKPLDPSEPPMPTPAPPEIYLKKQKAAQELEETKRPQSKNGICDLDEREIKLYEYIERYARKASLPTMLSDEYIPDLLSLPRLRKVSFNQRAEPYSDSCSESSNKNVVAFIIQVTGRRARDPCSRCQKHKGPFLGCYLMSDKATRSIQKRIQSCANYYYNSNEKLCSLKSRSHSRLTRLADRDEIVTQLPTTRQATVHKPDLQESSNSQTKAKAVDSEVLEDSITLPGPTTVTDRQVQNRPWTDDRSNSVEKVVAVNSPVRMLDPSNSLEVDLWEIAPGYICTDASLGLEKIAFSMTSTQNQAISIVPNLGFQVLVIRPGTFHSWKDSGNTNKLRLCSVASGKVRVKMHGQDFMVGPNGMFKVGPGIDCVTMNPLYIDATLHVSILLENVRARETVARTPEMWSYHLVGDWKRLAHLGRYIVM